ncbi:MAG: alkane 1-monooxygenase [Pseudomonadota bacterium]
MSSADQISAPLPSAFPFWVSVTIFPLVAISAYFGGWTLFLVPLYTWGSFSLLDKVLGLDLSNADTKTADSALFWHRLVTLVWFPLQYATIFGALWWVAVTDHLSTFEVLGLFFGVGVVSGSIGITYAHELMHQKPALERRLADLLMASVLYGHFRTEHLLIHHRFVATPRDPATARYGESFFHFFPRVLRQSFVSAFLVEAERLKRRQKPIWHRDNPFWTYAVLQSGFLILAALIGGWLGVALFAFQALIAVWQLELVNYIEHYGLTRRYVGAGKYEHARPHHSWNATTRATNWLLINLQRHSDHHFKPDRRFPLLQTYGKDEAPQLPYGYAVMTTAAMIPPLFRKLMNRRVDAWRQRFYPDIEDWGPYNRAEWQQVD